MEPPAPPQPPPERLQVHKLGDLVVARDRIATLYKPTLVGGFLRRGEMAVVSGGSKAQKTWLAHGMAVAVAAGEPFVGLEVPEARRVLLIDYELDFNTLKARLSMFAGPENEYDDPQTWLDNVDVVSVRDERRAKGLETFGAVADIRALLLQAQEDREPYDLVMIDCLSRVPDVLEAESEIDNLSLTRILEGFTGLADGSGAGIVVMHHTAKGSGIGRDLIDRGRGGSALAAVPETVASLIRDGGNDGWRQFEWTARTFKPSPPLVITLDTKGHPATWKRTNTEPVLARNDGTRVGDTRGEILEILRDLESELWVTTAELSTALKDKLVEVSERTVRAHLKGLVDSRIVDCRKAGRRNEKEYRLMNGVVVAEE